MSRGETKKRELVCPCGKTFIRLVSKIQIGTKNYCSRECFLKHGKRSLAY